MEAQLVGLPVWSLIVARTHLQHALPTMLGCRIAI